jgi:hypothetical protein
MKSWKSCCGKIGGNRIAPSESQSLHRSKAAKQVFADAEHFAEMANSVVFPVQLLFAVVSIEDEVRDDLLDQLGVQPERLNKVAKRAVAFPWREKPSAGRN